ncbi:MAG: sugar phosphate isomerase/epimerase family protein [Chloroflexota bacterium]
MTTPRGHSIDLGCMNRPWAKHPFDDALAGIARAGFQSFGLLNNWNQDIKVTGDSDDAEADALGARIRDAGLTLRMIPCSVPLDRGHADAVSFVGTLARHAERLGVKILLEMGSSNPDRYDDYFAVMRDAAPVAADHGVTIALKPHGGLSTTSDDCLRAIERVDHPAYRLTYDPGNLLYYAGEAPEPALIKLRPYVVAVCVKDETGSNGPDRAVDLTPGDGDVNFPVIVKTLLDTSFHGPAIVETLAPGSVDEVNDHAARAHRYLSSLIGA